MVRATFAGFSTALSALQANQKRLDITGQNLANMNTVGYTRQQLETSSLNYTNPVSHYMSVPTVNVGFGVRMDRVSQIRDPYLDAQYRAQMSKASYTGSIQTALDSLANVLDESNISGIRQAFANIQSTLTNMHDTPNVIDPVYESELRSRMQALTNLLNDASKQITEAEKNEFDRLNGDGTSESGAEQRVNDILRQIGDLNVQIKQNQIVGQPALELLDNRNSLLDELAGYLPIEVSYFKDANHTGQYNYTYTDAQGTTHTEVRDKMYEYDSNGKVIGKKEWPDDLKVEMVYKDDAGATQRLTLVNGTEGGQGNNYGKIEIQGTRTAPTNTSVAVYSSAGSTAADVTITANTANASTPGYGSLADGSIQAGLDMLESTGTTGGVNNVRGYEYYMNRLNTLASSFAKVMNTLNINGGEVAILADKTGNNGAITAANIGISTGWVNGTVHIGTKGDSQSDTVTNMLEAMTKTYPDSGIFTDINLENKSFADYTNNLSTILANDSLANQTAMKTNVTVLNGIQDSRDSISGISLDEEAANMMTYVSAYNAASRLMTALDEVLNTLINNTGLVGR